MGKNKPFQVTTAESFFYENKTSLNTNCVNTIEYDYLPDEDRIEKGRPLLAPENFFVVELTIAVAMLLMVGIGEVSLNVGVFAWVEFVGDMGLIGGMDGIPGTLNLERSFT